MTWRVIEGVYFVDFRMFWLRVSVACNFALLCEGTTHVATRCLVRHDDGVPCIKCDRCNAWIQPRNMSLPCPGTCVYLLEENHV